MAADSVDNPRDSQEESTARGYGARVTDPSKNSGFTPPTALARYVIKHEIGRGGRGVVFKAWDPSLKRMTAIKLVQGHRRSQTATQRFVLEARALAQLSHPNVVEIFDAGTYDDEKSQFIVMALLEGLSLTRWLRTSRSAGERIRVFVAAGRGLAAAHARDIVHRDFKPDNVIVGGDGDVKVLDFGLAAMRGTGSTDHGPSNGPQGSTGDVRDSAPLTRLTIEGTVMGTPRYMAPEQLAGDAIGAQADQYSFCLAFLAALRGDTVFTTSSLKKMRAAKMQRNLLPTPKDDSTPRWLRSVLLRGLSAKPGDRWPSMSALLRAIVISSRRRPRSLIAAASIGLVVASAAWVLEDPSEVACSHAATRIDEALADAALTIPADTLQALPSAAAEEIQSAVLAWGGSSRDAWRGAYTDTCTARTKGALTDRAFDRRMNCLHSVRARWTALAGVVREAKSENAGRLARHVARAPRAGLCANDDALTQDAELPVAADREEVERLRDTLARANAEAKAGHIGDSLALLAETRASAEALGLSALSC
ncbi:MAG: serine/threonine protein kinase [Nannocystaceae bacterium]|nr:serine/threonine protein kinase [Nannocystaceae bacterium]